YGIGVICGSKDFQKLRATRLTGGPLRLVLRCSLFWLAAPCRQLHYLPGWLGFLDSIVGRYFKQRFNRFSATDVGQLIRRFTSARITVTRHYHHLEIVGIPSFTNDLDSSLITYLSRGNCNRCASTVGFYSIKGLFA